MIEVLHNHAPTLVNSHVSKVLPFQLFMACIQVLRIIELKHAIWYSKVNYRIV